LHLRNSKAQALVLALLLAALQAVQLVALQAALLVLVQLQAQQQLA
jgi:hypothetical protein